MSRTAERAKAREGGVAHKINENRDGGHPLLQCERRGAQRAPLCRSLRYSLSARPLTAGSAVRALSRPSSSAHIRSSSCSARGGAGRGGAGRRKQRQLDAERWRPPARRARARGRGGPRAARGGNAAPTHLLALRLADGLDQLEKVFRQVSARRHLGEMQRERGRGKKLAAAERGCSDAYTNERAGRLRLAEPASCEPAPPAPRRAARAARALVGRDVAPAQLSARSSPHSSPVRWPCRAYAAPPPARWRSVLA